MISWSTIIRGAILKLPTPLSSASSDTLKSKNPTAQVNELLAKIVAYNLTVGIHEMYENGINPDFLNQNHFPRKAID